MNVKTRIKTGARDVYRGTLQMRPDIFVFMAMVYVMTASVAVLVLIEHGDLTAADERILGDGLEYLFYLILGFPVIVGVLGAGAFAILRRTRWADQARWADEKYVTKEEHEVALKRVKAETVERIEEAQREQWSECR